MSQGARFLSRTGLGNLIGRAQLLPAPAVDKSWSPSLGVEKPPFYRSISGETIPKKLLRFFVALKIVSFSEVIFKVPPTTPLKILFLSFFFSGFLKTSLTLKTLTS